MSSDIYLQYGGDIQFGPSNDVRTCTDKAFVDQRVIRRLLSNPGTYDASGNPVLPPTNLFSTGYGAGLTRDIEAASDNAALADQDSRIKAAMQQEPTVDQTKPILVDFAKDVQTDKVFCILQYTAIYGFNMQSGVSQ